MHEFQRYPAAYVVVEGPDFAGKTSVIYEAQKLIDAEYARRGMDTNGASSFLVRPSYGMIGEFMRENIGQLAKESLLYLFVADQLQHEKALIPLLGGKRIVLSDRHAMVSSWVYQQEYHSLDSVVCVLNHECWIAPDTVVILDIDPNTVLQRVLNREYTPLFHHERYEPDLLRRIRNRYFAYALLYDDLRYEVWEGGNPIEENAKKLCDLVFKILDEKANEKEVT